MQSNRSVEDGVRPMRVGSQLATGDQSKADVLVGHWRCTSVMKLDSWRMVYRGI